MYTPGGRSEASKTLEDWDGFVNLDLLSTKGEISLTYSLY